MYPPLLPEAVRDAHARISPFIHRTPLLTSEKLNHCLGHELIFKAENYQKTGAFKVRGALNTLLSLKAQGLLPKEVVTFSSGNHAQAVAWAANQLGVKATVMLPGFASKVKKQATEAYGARVITADTRQEAEALAIDEVTKGAYLIPPFDMDTVIAGQGTACLEALEDGANPDAVFVPCGGGGLTSGTYLATRLLAPKALVFAAEPLQANDAARSCREGKVFSFDTSPPTLADGARTLSISERTFHYLKQLNGIIEIEEETMIWWTQWLTHLLKTSCEPTSALAMAAAFSWLQTQSSPKRVLIILSGGNIAPETYQQIWAKDYLTEAPWAAPLQS